MDNLAKDATIFLLTVTLQLSVLTAAGSGGAGGGTTIARLMPNARAPNTWRSNGMMWLKWTKFCSQDGLELLDGSELPSRRYG